MNSIAENRKKGCYFVYNDRLILEFYLAGKGKFTKVTKSADLAQIFCKSQRAIQQEIKRGKVEHLNSDLTTSIVYNAEYAQQNTVFFPKGQITKSV